MIRSGSIYKDEMKQNTKIHYGLTGDGIHVQGKLDIDMEMEGEKFNHEFQVIGDLGHLKADGIMGRDFMWGRTIINMIDGTMTIMNVENESGEQDCDTKTKKGRNPYCRLLKVTKEQGQLLKLLTITLTGMSIQSC